MRFSRGRQEMIIQFLKFVGVGVLNTLVSLITIYVLMSFQVDYKLANLIGYIVGVINSFIWNKVWVFKSHSAIGKEIFWFLLSFLICYSIQYFMLLVLVEKWNLNEYLSQLISMGVYTVINYLLNHFITFRK